jgi:hydroxymethylglutaryl-CoA reductase (NADPH)
MSSWTRLVGDPILSKWIVVVLDISISLNGYLLKGIASGVVGGRFTGSLGVGFGKGAVRFEEEEEAEEDADREVVENGRVVVIPPQPEMDRDLNFERCLAREALASFKMEELDRKLQTVPVEPRTIAVRIRRALICKFFSPP